MILHPGVLALFLGSLVTLLFVLLACGVGLGILRHWNYQSSSARQLALERRTYLVSAVMNYALGFSVVSVFLFLRTVDDLHPLLVGAMCATGALNANPVGWAALSSKLVLLLAAGLWIGVNRLDQQAEDYPLVRLKYRWLFWLAPLVAADAVLQGAYFLGIEPAIITSCCGSLFSGGGAGLASTLAAFPPGPSLAVFYGGCALYALAGAACLRSSAGGWRYLLGVLAGAMLLVSLASVVSVFSLYFYESPIHHCPFDLLQGGYGYVGYPLYAALAVWALFGLLPAVLQPLRRVPSLAGEVPRCQRRYVRWSLVGMVAFVALASYPVVFGPFVLLGY